MKRKHSRKKSTEVLVAFIIGQAVQIVCHAVSMSFWESRRIPFCAAAGFLIAVAVFAGMYINKPEPQMSYHDWASAPGGEMDLND